MHLSLRHLSGFACALATASVAHAQLSLSSQFSSGLSQVGMGYDQVTNTVWVYPSFGATLNHYTPSGTLLGSVPRPGESANDADIDVAPVALTVGSTLVPAGTVLFFNGETGPADIYAINPSTGAVLATLNTGFGVSHVVGGAYHPQRATFFLVQDRVPGAADENRVAEINASTGAVLNVFLITAVRPSFTVNFGDLGVAGNGNLLIVSSDETSILELTPAGAFVRELPLPAGVNDLCGIGYNFSNCDVWVASESNQVARLTLPSGEQLCSIPCPYTSDFNGDGDFGTDADIEAFFACLAGVCCPSCGSSDFNGDGDFGTDADIESFFRVLGGGPC